MLASRQNIIALVLLLTLLGFALAWYWYSSPILSEDALVMSDTRISPGLAETRAGILRTIEAMRSIKLDKTILMDPAFLRLTKVARPPVEDPGTGRSNPFAPYKAPVKSGVPAGR